MTKNLSRYQIHTDLAIEKEIEGNIIKYYRDLNIISNKANTFITIEFTDVTDALNRQELVEGMTLVLKEIMANLKIGAHDKCLVIGIGNPKSTPDALGANVVKDIIVTSHLFTIDDFIVDSNYRNVAAISPGVASTTGIDSFAVIDAVVKKVKPDFLIIIDSLVASSLDRVNKVMQFTTIGIAPGSGVGYTKNEINQETFGIPVIAIGVPTVIDANVIVNDTLTFLNRKYPAYQEILPLKEMDEEELTDLLNSILNPINYNLMVTPKEIDFTIKSLSSIIATGINNTLHNK